MSVAAPQTDRFRVLRFLAVGGGFSLFYAVLSAFLIGPVGLPAFATSVILYALCIPAAFWAQKRVTFRSEGRAGLGRSFVIYGATQLAALALVAAVTTRFVTQVMLYDTIIFGLTAGLAALLSYWVSSRFAFTAG